MTDTHNAAYRLAITVSRAQLNAIKYSVLLIWLTAPLAYLVYQTSFSTPPDESAATNSVTIDAPAETAEFGQLFGIGLSYLNNNQPDKSIPYLQQAININPQSALAYNNLGVAYTLQKQYQAAIAALEKALQLDPNMQLARNNLHWARSEQSHAK